MLLPCALPYLLLVLSTLRQLDSCLALLLSVLLLDALLLIVLGLLLLLHVLVLTLLLGLLLLVVLDLLLLMLHVLFLSLLLSVLWLSMLRLGPGCFVSALPLFGMFLPFALLLVLGPGRRPDPEEQRQNSCAGDSDCFHRYYLRCCWMLTLVLLQASGLRIDRVSDRIAGYEQFHSPVLLPAGGVVVRGYRQGVAETSCAD